MQKDSPEKKEGAIYDTPLEKRPQYDAEQIEELRKRLYSRGADTVHTVRHGVPQRPRPPQSEVTPAPTPTHTPVRPQAAVDGITTMPHHNRPPEHVSEPETESSDTIEGMGYRKARKTYRKVVAIIGTVFFIIALGVSSFLLFSGGNVISGDNITITTEGNIAVGGGEEYEFQVSIANQNNVAIQSATLIVEYPRGSRTADEEGREISIERTSLDVIEKGEVVNISKKVRIYGEEQEQKEIKVWIEYRVAGSNAIFEKNANPRIFTVTSSPVVVSFDSVESIPSGKETTLDITVQSNSPTPLTGLLLKVSYPEGFDYTSAKPDTVSGEDTWSVSTLDPGEKYTVSIKGVFTGIEGDVRVFDAVLGVANQGGGNVLASQLATAQTEVTIETSALEMGMLINDSSSEIVVVEGDDRVTVEVSYTNSLNSTVSGARIITTLGGNALADYEIQGEGEYNESTQTLTSPAYNEIFPGQKIRSLLVLVPTKEAKRTAEVTITARIEGTRVTTNQVPQTLEGSVARTFKIQSVPTLTSMTNYMEGPFVNTGPIPPVVGKVTQYTYLLTAKAGSNDLTEAEVTAVLPANASWLDLVTPGDTVTYNSTTRTLRWDIGDISANQEERVGIQVSFTPTESQEGRVPTILETQRFKATDRFTGTTVRAEAPALTTRLSLDPKDLDDARVEED